MNRIVKVSGVEVVLGGADGSYNETRTAICFNDFKDACGWVDSHDEMNAMKLCRKNLVMNL